MLFLREGTQQKHWCQPTYVFKQINRILAPLTSEKGISHHLIPEQSLNYPKSCHYDSHYSWGKWQLKSLRKNVTTVLLLHKRLYLQWTFHLIPSVSDKDPVHKEDDLPCVLLCPIWLLWLMLTQCLSVLARQGCHEPGRHEQIEIPLVWTPLLLKPCYLDSYFWECYADMSWMHKLTWTNRQYYMKLDLIGQDTLLSGQLLLGMSCRYIMNMRFTWKNWQSTKKTLSESHEPIIHAFLLHVYMIKRISQVINDLLIWHFVNR